ncbi:MAG: hypothetical protein E6Z74_10085 [Clostridium perfringens]|nr:hypothetical protein [Clostridium butyricum]MDU5776262.1 hypothetical protein [Clostridium perfringens]
MEDLTGKKYSKLTVIKFSGKRESHAKWLCLCECGKETIVDGWQLEKVFNKPLDIKCSHKKEDLKEDK